MAGLPEAEIQQYNTLAKTIRKAVLTMIYRTKSPHLGCSFSIVELLTALYFRVLKINDSDLQDPDRDRFLLSKGHGCATLYAVLAERGIIKKDLLEGFARDGSVLGQHPNRDTALGIEMTSGSLGHGLSVGTGMAWAAKCDNAGYRTFVFLGDGELDEGSCWEAAMFAGHHKLDNLVAIVDYNKLQAMDRSSEILDLAPLADKWRSFGWETREINGHNFEEIIPALESLPFKSGKPSCIIAHTIKGKGVSFLENDPRWHDKYPDDEEYQKAMAELA